VRAHHRAAALVAASLVALLVRLPPLVNADLLWQIRGGEALLRGADATHDTGARFLRGATLADHERGFELAVAWVHALGGFALLWWLLLAATVAFFVLSARRALRAGAAPAGVEVGCAIAALALSARIDLRADLCSACALFLALATAPEPSDPVSARSFAPAVLAAAFAPLHGLAPIVAIVPVARAAYHAYGGRFRRAALEAAVAAACVVIPAAVSPPLLENALRHAQGSIFTAHIVEYRPLWRVLDGGLPWSALVAPALMGVSARGLWSRGARTKPVALVLLALASLRFARLAALPVLAALPWVLEGFAIEWARATSRRGTRTRAACAALAFAIACFAASAPLRAEGAHVGFDWRKQPVDAVAHLARVRPDAHVFHSFNFGAYLLWTGYPASGVLIDPRAAALYPNDFAQRYQAALDDPHRFDEWAREAGFDVTLLSGARSERALVAHLSESEDWVLESCDGVSCVFVRRSGASARGAPDHLADARR
jgi:hypothetical protein